MTPRPSLVLDVVLDLVFRTALLFAVFLLVAGHNAPGGGFVGGLVASTALVLRFVTGGVEEVDRIVPVPERVLLGGGLFLAFLTGAAGWLLGGAFLYGAKGDLDVPILGTLKATSALVFDVGVAGVVVGLVLSVLRALGGPDEPPTPAGPVGATPGTDETESAS
ncbi:MAG TPA: MnhB domain-containing protein [Nitriliruptoraceae bacterium]|nr:MnhB domain-containing protein [Nitriliruptoraceae bacterium]